MKKRIWLSLCLVLSLCASGYALAEHASPHTVLDIPWGSTLEETQKTIEQTYEATFVQTNEEGMLPCYRVEDIRIHFFGYPVVVEYSFGMDAPHPLQFITMRFASEKTDSTLSRYVPFLDETVEMVGRGLNVFRQLVDMYRDEEKGIAYRFYTVDERIETEYAVPLREDAIDDGAILSTLVLGETYRLRAVTGNVDMWFEYGAKRFDEGFFVWCDLSVMYQENEPPLSSILGGDISLESYDGMDGERVAEQERVLILEY